ncbi:hypothetical protein V2J09_015649 [Rumex salicifolius]
MFGFELQLDMTAMDPKPQAAIPLWKSKIDDPKFNQADLVLIVLDRSSKTRHKFASAIVGDKHQVRRLYNACKGISQVMPSPITTSDPATPSTSMPTTVEDIQATRSQPSSSINDNGWGIAPPDPASHNDWNASNPSSSKASSSGWITEPTTHEFNGWALPEASTSQPQPNHETAPVLPTTNEPVGSYSSSPSAPPLPYDDGPIHYPSIDMTPVEVSAPTIQNEAPKPTESKDNDENMCVICWESSVEGACIPCGHMAGCMSCLNVIKSKKGDCPVCRAKISQVVRLYAV